MTKSSNNFKTGDQQEKKWRLWVVFHPGSECFQKWGEKRAFFNWNDNTEQNKEGLIFRIFKKNENQIKKAILYDNQSGEILANLK